MQARSNMTRCRLAVPVMTGMFLLFLLAGMAGASAADQGGLRGMIMDIQGRPVKEGEVYAYTTADVKRPADFISKSTEVEGRYELILPPGHYWVVARQRHGGSRFGPLLPADRHSGDPKKIEVAKGEVKECDFTVANIMEAARLNPKKRDDLEEISGKVLDREGNPVAMAYVMASSHQRPAGFPDYISGWTEKEGTFLIFLPKGSFFLGATKTFPPADGIFLDKKVDITSNMGDLTLEAR